MAEMKKESKIKNWFKGVKNEFKKITWPSFRTITNNTGIVIAVSLIIGVIVLLLDWGFGAGAGALLTK